MLLDIHILDNLLILESLKWYYGVEKGKKKNLRILVHTAKLHFIRIILTYKVTAIYEMLSSAILCMLGVPAS